MAKRKYVKENNLVKAINTDSLELQKPLVNEYYNINIHNSNMDKIDTGYKQNKNDILNINNELSKTENTKYSTENGVKEFGCKDGYIDNVVIEGETLVNLFSFKKTESSNNNSVWIHINTDYISLFKEVEYTLINTSDKNIFVDIYSNDTNSYKRNLLIKANSSIKDTLTSNEHYSKCTGLFSDSWNLSDLSVISSALVILEGDHTDKPISYFEGLKSVGQGDKIEILTRNQSNKNLFYGDVELGYIDNKTGINGDSVNGVRSVEYIKVDKNTTYTVSDDKGYNVSVNLYGENKSEYFGEIFGKTPYTFTTDDKTYWIRLRTYTGNKQNDTTIKWQLEKGNKSTEYVQPKCDKKQISTTLRSLPNGVKDTIEKRGNKYVKVQRCKEIVLDSSLEFTGTAVSNQVNTKGQNIIISDMKKDINSLIICDSFKSIINADENEVIDEEHLINLGDGRLRIRVLRSKLSASSMEAVKSYLDSTRPTIVYELETPIIIELPNFNPQTYEGDTTLLLNTGVIQGECEFEVTNSIGSEIEVLKDKISSLDDYVVEEEVYYPTLLNGFIKASSSDVLKVVKNGNICSLQISVTNSSNVSSGTIIAKLPLRFAPKDCTRVCGFCGSNTAQSIYNIDITSNSEIIIYKEYTANSPIRINASWEVK